MLTLGIWLAATLDVLAGATPKEPVTRFCDLPADCGAGGVCIGYVCRDGSDRAKLEVLHRVAVLPPVLAIGSSDLASTARVLVDALRIDLASTGFYEVVPPAAHPASAAREGASPAEVRRVAWVAAGVDRIVQTACAPRQGVPNSLVCKIKIVETERWTVFDFDGARIVATPTEAAANPIIVQGSAGARQLATTWTNALVGHDTGIPGALGTRVAGTSEMAPGNKEIVIVGADGGGWQAVTRNRNLNLNPAWGPGGVLGWMSYAAGNADWWVDGKPLSTRPGLNAGGTWSPDGRSIALSVAETGDAEIVLLDAKTGQEEARLTDDPAIDTSPSWSPDGKRLAFMSDRGGSQPQIYILSLAGGPLEQVTQGGYNVNPDWSPSAQSIAFQRQNGNDFVIMRYDLDTGAVKRLTTMRGSAENPSFSPDGRYIAFSLVNDKQARLWVMTADGDAPHPVGGEAADRSFLAPSWERTFPAPR